MDDENITYSTGSFNYSAIKPENLSETAYTLVTIAVDTSGSVDSFKSDLINMLKAVLESCKKSPKVENLLIRLVNFNNAVVEIHGFQPIQLIDEAIYNNLDCGGRTALNDAVYSSVDATLQYSKILISQYFNVNGIIFIITDGDDNFSSKSTIEIKKLVTDCVQTEAISNITTILIAINDAQFKAKLQNFQQEVGINQYVSVSDANPQKLAKLANFVSQSISSKSQSINGTVSQTLTI